MDETFTALTGVGLPVTAACRLVGRARASHYRHARPAGPGAASAAPTRAAGVDPGRAGRGPAVINSAGYADLSIGQIWARELDEGRYWCSMSSMYRIARAAGQTRERRRQATHPATGETGTGRRRPVAGVVLGHHEAPRAGQGSLVPPVRADRHLLPVQPGVDRRRGRGFSAGKGFHRRGDHPQRDGAAHGARRPGHLDDLQTGVRVCSSTSA